MGSAISVRLDDEAEQALRTLEAAGFSRSEAIRDALVRSANRLRRSSELAAEVAALEVWLERFPDFSLADPDAVRWSGGQVRGPRVLPLSFGR